VVKIDFGLYDGMCVDKQGISLEELYEAMQELRKEVAELKAKLIAKGVISGY